MMENFILAESFIATLCFLTLLYLSIWVKIFSRKKYPPGPYGLPVIGHLPLLGSKPVETFRRWNRTYGNVFRIRMGRWNTVVLNGYSTVKDAMEKRHDEFSSRPDFHSAKILRNFHNNENTLSFGPFNEAYLKQRKLSAYALRKFTNVRDDYLQELILDETEKMISELLAQKEAQDVTETAVLSTGSIIYQVLFGKGENVWEDTAYRDLMKKLEDFTEFVAVGSTIDVLPWLRFFLSKDLVKYEAFVSSFDEVIWQKIRAHKYTFNPNNIRDVTDAFLAADLPETVADRDTDVSRTRLLHTLFDLLGAGTGTTSSAVRWLILYMTAYPDVQMKVQHEIDSIVCKVRGVTLKDKDKLHYTQATITEVMRLSNVSSLSLPHYTTMDTTINGYDIDKGTVVIVNLTSVNLDETVWDNPKSFRPERHLDDNYELKRRSCVMPFGLGRRRCAGEILAKAELFLMFCTLMRRCSFIQPETETLDLESVGTFLDVPKPFRVIVKERQ